MFSLAEYWSTTIAFCDAVAVAGWTPMGDVAAVTGVAQVVGADASLYIDLGVAP